MNHYLYYPGCSMDSAGKAYNLSLNEISKTIDLELEEIDDWNCCGATEYVSISRTPAYSLISRNLALAAKQSNGTKTVIAPCSACFLNLYKADYYMRERKELNDDVNTALAAGGLSYQPGTITIRHILDVIVNDIGLDVLKQKTVQPLKGLRVAPYMGCMVSRPDYENLWSSHEYPDELDKLLNALGAEVIDFPLKTHCCGGHMTQIEPSTAFELLRRLLSAADQYKADLLVTICPMCQMNLDAYQGETNKHFNTSYNIPILFFTQLIGLALGKDPKKLGIGLELVSAKNALRKIGVEIPDESASTPRKSKRVKKEGLPMPVMPGDKEVD